MTSGPFRDMHDLLNALHTGDRQWGAQQLWDLTPQDIHYPAAPSSHFLLPLGPRLSAMPGLEMGGDGSFIAAPPTQLMYQHATEASFSAADHGMLPMQQHPHLHIHDTGRLEELRGHLEPTRVASVHHVRQGQQWGRGAVASAAYTPRSNTLGDRTMSGHHFVHGHGMHFCYGQHNDCHAPVHDPCSHHCSTCDDWFRFCDVPTRCHGSQIWRVPGAIPVQTHSVMQKGCGPQSGGCATMPSSAAFQHRVAVSSFASGVDELAPLLARPFPAASATTATTAAKKETRTSSQQGRLQKRAGSRALGDGTATPLVQDVANKRLKLGAALSSEHEPRRDHDHHHERWNALLTSGTHAHRSGHLRPRIPMS